MTQKIRKIERALISVSDKRGLVEFAQFLQSHNVEIISTGGTAKTLREAGVPVVDISDFTGFPEIMDGRVKTLHPKVHGGLLNIRDNVEHQKAKKDHGIKDIDLVVVNLYPFEETVKKGADYHEVIENIDIGGPSMIRSAAKNHDDVTVIVNPDRYQGVMQVITEHNGATTLELRQALAAEAFSRTAEYDSNISRWFAAQAHVTFPESLTISAKSKQILRYGENPHQKAALYVYDRSIPGIANATQLHGKELSYNNIADADAAYELVNEFNGLPAVAIIKHANPCGVAISENLADAYKKALACDPVSAYGGIFAFNDVLDADAAKLLSEIFAEVVIAPKFSEEALAILTKKQNIRLLEAAEFNSEKHKAMQFKSVSGGFLLQEQDTKVLNEGELEFVTKRKPTEQELKDLVFAFKVCKHVKSNAIVYALNQATVGVGAGQMSRIDSARIGAWKARETATSVPDAKGSVLASDAFFPFADGLESAAEHGVTAVIQPGGSIRDDEVIAAAEKHNIAMVFTKIRHFRH
jgi:phosphoribosylaminoimidazolecarboxamide formyltransferase/IMP cyclohydrolase